MKRLAHLTCAIGLALLVNSPYVGIVRAESSIKSVRSVARPSVGVRPWPAVIQGTTKVLGPSAMRHLEKTDPSPLDTTASHLTLIFRRPNRTLLSLRRGDVIVAGITPQAPQGLIRTVASVRAVSAVTRRVLRSDIVVKPAHVHIARLIVHTGTASLLSAIPAGSFDKTFTFQSECLPIQNRQLNVDAGGSAVSGVQATANGQVCLSGALEIAAAWSGSAVTSALFKVVGTQTLQLSLDVNGPGVLSPPLSIFPATMPLGTYTIKVDNAPIVVTPTLAWHLGFTMATAGAGGSLDLHQQADVSTWVSCDRQGCAPGNSFISTFAGSSASITSSRGELKIVVGPQFRVWFFGTVPGPQLNVDSYGRVSTTTDPNGALYGGIDASIDYPFTLWGINQDAGYTIPTEESTIAEPLLSPSPLPASRGYPSPEAAIAAWYQSAPAGIFGSSFPNDPYAWACASRRAYNRACSIPGPAATSPPLSIYTLLEIAPGSTPASIVVPLVYLYLGRFHDGSWIVIGQAPCSLAAGGEPLTCLQQSAPIFTP